MRWRWSDERIVCVCCMCIHIRRKEVKSETAKLTSICGAQQSVGKDVSLRFLRTRKKSSEGKRKTATDPDYTITEKERRYYVSCAYICIPTRQDNLCCSIGFPLVKYLFILEKYLVSYILLCTYVRCMHIQMAYKLTAATFNFPCFGNNCSVVCNVVGTFGVVMFLVCCWVKCSKVI